MGALNDAFFFVTDKIILLQSFFMNFARGVAYVALLVSILMAAFNHVVTGTGLKDNVIKIAKAFIFYSIVMYAYPNIVSWMTQMSFSIARDSTFIPMRGVLGGAVADMERQAMSDRMSDEFRTYGTLAITEHGNIFDGMIRHRTFIVHNEDGEEERTLSYSVVAPAGALGAVMLVAGETWRFSQRQGGGFGIGATISNIPNQLMGLVISLFVIGVGVFTVLNYIIAFIEFMFVSSVGIMLFPLSLYEGTKFMAEKYITAMIGFFIKLLFCTICIFFMLYGYLSMASLFVANPFTGAISDIILIVFSSLLFLFISISAPGLAQGLLTGSPSLSAGGAIRTVASAAGAVAGVAGLAAGAGGLATRGGLALTGAGIQGFGAAKEAFKNTSPTRGTPGRAGVAMKAFAQSMGGQAAEAVGNNASNLVKSLAAKPLYKGGKSYAGGSSGGGPDAQGNYENVAQEVKAKGLRGFYGDKLRAGEQTGKKVADKDAKNLQERPNYSGSNASAPAPMAGWSSGQFG